MTRFNHCPNCHAKPSGGLFGGCYFKVYECQDCGTCYCYNCGGERCPNCASKRRQEVGEVWTKD
jgi:hypothetical protein